MGYKTPISIDRRHGFIRRQKLSDAAAHEGARRREGLIDPGNTASDMWADRLPFQSQVLADGGKTSRIHGKKPWGKPMPKRAARANAAKSRIRARLEHGFAQQKDRMHLAIRSLDIKRAAGDDHHGDPRLQSRPMAMGGRKNGIRLMAKQGESQAMRPDNRS